MKGQQKEIYDGLLEIAVSLKDGKYGKDDDIDVMALSEDIEEIVFE